jgi:DNA-directed RNA polymerase subunit RPC12/RpoP
MPSYTYNMGVDITKLLVKCSNCGYRFFTKKQTLSKDEVSEKRGALANESKDYQKVLDDLTRDFKTLNDKISSTKLIIKQINKDRDDLDTIIQCSKCGLRLHALECEVKE